MATPVRLADACSQGKLVTPRLERLADWVSHSVESCARQGKF